VGAGKGAPAFGVRLSSAAFSPRSARLAVSRRHEEEIVSVSQKSQ
jgi:hypothetical protein